MKTYLIKDSLGLLHIQKAYNTLEAFVEWCCTYKTMDKDMFVTRKELVKRGYNTLETTALDNVWRLVK